MKLRLKIHTCIFLILNTFFFTSCINSFSSDTGQYIKKIKEKNKIDSSHIFIIYNDYSCSSCIESTFMFFSHSIYTRDTFPSIDLCIYREITKEI